ncbi:WW domain-containing adapter protein with coiled-coil isoform X1 [Adelges cooleyi]|uniref:WW domain-containing adapter protein with coiled-coil isoform X1 n=1 Tax=Adelges cooleyi TaxID=133065 RepID=UPI00217FD819|nr:WW domain-containing adapter protein with coiled-coil isoform X1 [Adelges cooleyi]XP_050423273.1 WW domain-containing adapter protein with coiled-coil isoform X1 [Adelges cooleyi]XP_050423275.1 WW domain-containing adapter protein with coiled-coil isoform X1 [Adelges cooleyi]
MVMHARKLQRISDGYYDKNPSHQYQNSKYLVSKNSSSDQKYGSVRGNGTSYPSPGRGSPSRDRSYSSKSSYHSQKSHRDKERDSRDYKSRNSDKYSDYSRSPKDSRRSRDEYRTNHDRISPEKMVHSVKWSNSSRDSRDTRESGQRKVVNSSCQSSSSSNNRNSRSGESSVAKVGDWSEHTSSSGKKYYYNCKTEISQWDQPREWVEAYPVSQPSRTQYHHDKHSNSSLMRSSSMSNHVNKVPQQSSQQGNCTSRQTHHQKDTYWNQMRSSNHTVNVSQSHHVPESNLDRLDQEGPTVINSCDSSQTQDMELCSGDSTPTSEKSFQLSTMTAQQRHNSTNPQSQVKIGAETTIPSNNDSCERTNVDTRTATPPPIANVSQNLVDSISSTNNNTTERGPPTPTNSESVNTQENNKGSPIISHAEQAQANAVTPYRVGGTATSSIVSNSVRDDFTSHVKNWPADILAKQAQKLSEEAHILGSIHCSRVSAELKYARSVVRITEVQASLLEHKVLFLERQIKTLEKLKSENSFMGEGDEGGTT